MAGIQIDGVNNKIDFDDDLDTSISANVDDTLVFEIAGATDFTMTANDFTALSGSVISTDNINETTSGSGVTIDGVLLKDGNITMSGLAAGSGITLDLSGSDNYIIEESSTNDVIDFGQGGANTKFSHNISSGALTIRGASTITTADNSDTLSLISTDADGAEGPHLRLFRNSSSPADNDNVGRIRFDALNDASESVTTFMINNYISDVTDGTEDSTTEIYQMLGGSLRKTFHIKPSELVINDDSQDVDFRVESNGNANMLFVDGGNNRVNMGSATDVAATLVVSAGDSGVTTPDANGNLFVIEKNDNCGMSILSSTDGGGYIHFGDSGDIDIGVIEYSHPDNSLRFTVNAAERMRITSTGNSTLNGHANDTDVLAVKFDNNTANPRGIKIEYTDAAPDDQNAAFLRCVDTGTTRMFIMNDGDLLNHDGAYNAISDQRLKQDITDANSQWNDLKAIKVRNFKKKDDVRAYGENAPMHIGVIAQELETVSPKLVKTHPPEASDIIYSAEFGTLYTADDAETKDGNDAVLYVAEDQEVIDGEHSVGDIKTEATHSKKVGDLKEVGDNVKSVKASILYMKAIKALQEAMTRIETLETKVTALEG